MDSMDDPELTQTLNEADSLEAVHRVCARIAGALGFPYFLFGFRIPVPLTQPCQLILSGYPPAWRQRYDQQHYMQFDPVLRQAVGGVLPVHWDRVPRDGPRAGQLFDEAAGFGLRYGLTLPVHGAHGEFSLFSLASPDPLPPAGAGCAELIWRAHGFAAQLHTSVRGLLLQAAPRLHGEPPPHLSARECDCLRRAAEGQPAGAIAQDLGISENTVIYHLKECRQKLQVQTRQQAIARAVALGEIRPECYPNRLAQSQRFVEARLH